MEKEENFIVMGILIGVLLIIVVVLGIYIKVLSIKENKPSNTTVVDVEKEEKEEEKVDFKEIYFLVEEPHVTSDFTVDVVDDAGTITHELFFNTNYKNYYFHDIGSTFTYININKKLINVKDALNNGVISIYDLKDKLGDSIIEEDRYSFVLGNNQNGVDGNITYQNAKELFIKFDDNTLPISSYSKEEIVNLLNFMTAEEKVKAYSINNTKSHMYEVKSERIYTCENGSIYITSKAIDLDCN